MPIETVLIDGMPVTLETCPLCHHQFVPFLRGQVQRWPYRFLFWGRRPYCALICWHCKEIIGWE